MAYIKYVAQKKMEINDTDNILKIHNISPKIMKRHYELFLELMKKKSPLSRLQREMIAVKVSQANGCDY